jgi:hypothetical protein
VTYEGVAAALKNWYGDYLLVEVFHTQLKRKTQHARESL